MKKILIMVLLSGISSITMAQNISIGISSSNNNVNNLAQCKEIDDAKLNMLSQVNMQKEICLYENYAKLTDKWTTSPPEPYRQPNSIIISMNKKEMSQEMKDKLIKIGQQCQELGVKMRAKLKETYGVENFQCK
jgi:hypothetical protein